MVNIINATLELTDLKEWWHYDKEQRCWCLEDVLYTMKATTPEFQRLSVFVPASYMVEPGKINLEGRVNGYTAGNAPVVLKNNSGGYRQMPHRWPDDPDRFGQEYLERGFVYVTCGNRGYDSLNQDGKRCGKAPVNLIDLKTVIRFLRHNSAALPGDVERIVSVGTSAGGAMSTLLAVTGNSRDYAPYLEEAGAFMDERDDVYAAQIYCPIIDLEHADLAYEWMFSADKESEIPNAGSGRTMTPFQEALSEKLKEAYIHYFNSLGLRNPVTGQPMLFGADGRSGTAYDYLMEKLGESATKSLRKMDGETGEYIRGKEDWLLWNGTVAAVSDLDTYVLGYRRRMKPCTSFDRLSCDSCENEVFGRPEQEAVHFNTEIVESITDLKDAFPEEYETYYRTYAAAAGDAALARQKHLINPMNYIGAGEMADVAQHFRIRVGANDADTSFMVSMALAVKLANAGEDVDYAFVWDQPHCAADYPGEFCDWIESICPT